MSAVAVQSRGEIPLEGRHQDHHTMLLVERPVLAVVVAAERRQNRDHEIVGLVLAELAERRHG